MATPFPFGSGNVLLASQLNAITTLPINDQTASYVAVVGDVGKRIVMNVASANTVTINNSVFAVGDTIFIANKGAGSTTVTAGAGVTINTEGSLVLAQHGGGTLVALSASVFTFFRGGGANYGTATGGTTITPWTISSINYNGSQFTSDGTLTVTKAGLFDILMFGGGAGGGGGQSATNRSGGGGGAGGILQATVYLSANISITVGAGGAGGSDTASGGGGSPSYVGSVLNILGGGSGQSASAGTRGATGGGDFGLTGYTSGNPLLSTAFGGYDGGTGANEAAGGGGGSVTATGGNASGNTGGAGAAGYDVSAFIGGSALRKGAGGGGGGPTTGGAGGSSIGGAGGGTNSNGSAAAANTASGGGGAHGGAYSGGAGGSGIVYIRFKV